MTALTYRPHPFFKNGHVQTMLVGILCGERPSYRATPHLVPLPDGEALVVHEENGPPLPKSAHLVILVHGLGGDHRSAYLERLAPQLRGLGFDVWRVDLRGCGEGAAHAWQPVNAGRSDDLAEVINKAAEVYPEKPVHVVGFSLSGNILLKMLGEAGKTQSPLKLEQGRLTSAIAVAPPIRLHECADNMDRFSRRVYTKFYLKMLAGQVEDRKRQWPRWQEIPAEPAVRTIRQFDARYTAPLSGYASAEDYYAQASAEGLLPYIKTTTEIIADRHDPIVPYRTLFKATLSATTQLTTTSYGGHMGYFGLDENGKLIRWLEYYVTERLKDARNQFENGHEPSLVG